MRVTSDYRVFGNLLRDCFHLYAGSASAIVPVDVERRGKRKRAFAAGRGGYGSDRRDVGAQSLGEAPRAVGPAALELGTLTVPPGLGL